MNWSSIFYQKIIQNCLIYKRISSTTILSNDKDLIYSVLTGKVGTKSRKGSNLPISMWMNFFDLWNLTANICWHPQLSNNREGRFSQSKIWFQVNPFILSSAIFLFISLGYLSLVESVEEACLVCSRTSGEEHHSTFGESPKILHPSWLTSLWPFRPKVIHPHTLFWILSCRFLRYNVQVHK